MGRRRDGRPRRRPGAGSATGSPTRGARAAGFPSPASPRSSWPACSGPWTGSPRIPSLTSASPTSPPPAAGLHRYLLLQHKRALLITTLLIITETLSLQAGPLLTQLGIDDGIVPRHFGVIALTAGLYLATVLSTAVASRARVRWTGRLAAWVMHDLRIRVFSQLQRMSLDYFTDEKAGVIMTRMTSDIEALQQLLQDGLAQFAIQGLTMVAVTVVLVIYSVKLALITLLLVVPLLTVFLALVPAGLQPGLPAGARRAGRRAVRLVGDAARDPGGGRAQPAAAQRAASPQRGRRVPGRQQLHRPDRVHLRARHGHARPARPGGRAADRRRHGAEAPADGGRADRVRAVHELAVPPGPAAGADLQQLPAGPGGHREAARFPRVPSRPSPRSPMPPMPDS